MTAAKEQHRRSIRLEGWDYSQPGAYFITMVTQGGICTFGEIVLEEMNLSGEGRVAEDCWRAIPDHFQNVELGAYVVMPNHVHGIIILHEREDRSAILSPTVGATHWVAPTGESQRVAPPNGPKRGSIGAIIGAYKMAVTRKIVQPHGGDPRVWQRNYYEHVIRDEAEHNRIRLYIESNPVNWMKDEENQERQR